MITREVKGKNPSDHDHGNNTKTPKNMDPSTSTNATTSWTRLKDPRIVRVSRAFGGKDRHSKVCTVRGLRDRRVRLSVPTAIQLYDLQDRLGLNQPSKVVDWLLNAAKDEIDELPPLQIPPHQGNFSNPNLYPMLGVGSSSTSQVNNNKEGLIKSTNWDVTLEPSNKEGINVMSYNSNFMKWDPSNLSLAHSGSTNSVHQQEDVHNFNVVTFPTTMSMPMLGNSQVFVYPQGLPQSFFHSHNINNAGAVPSSSDFDPKEINFQMLSSSTSENHLASSNSFRHSIESSTSQSHVRPFYFLPSQNSEGRESIKDREFQSN